MNLAPMRFKSFVWPHNPGIYAITMERAMGEHKIPFGLYRLQNLGQTRRVFRGEGEFVGQGAYDRFKALSNVFYEGTPGPLVHPVWMATKAWFVKLRLEQRPRRDYVRYSFEFWEVLEEGGGTLTPREEAGTSAPVPAGGAEPLWYTVAQGDSLWGIARQFDTTVAELLGLNPDIRNPNLILRGQKVRVG